MHPFGTGNAHLIKKGDSGQGFRSWNLTQEPGFDSGISDSGSEDVDLCFIPSPNPLGKSGRV